MAKLLAMLFYGITIVGCMFCLWISFMVNDVIGRITFAILAVILTYAFVKFMTKQTR